MFRFKQRHVHDDTVQQNFEQVEPNIFDIGDLKPTARSDSPNGWLQCDGAAVSRTTYAALFQAIGTTFGTGDGSTTFNVPDMRGRAPIGTGDGGANYTDRALGDDVGAETHTLTSAESGMPAHSTGNDTPDHTHFISSQNLVASGSATASGAAFIAPVQGATSTQGASTRHTHPVTGVAASAAHSIMSPSLAVNWLIKT